MAWVRVAALSDFGGRQVIGVACGGTRLALYHLADGVFATSDRCPHAGAPLSRGCVVEGFIECPVHFSLFDIRTGAADGGMTTTKLRTVPVKVEQDEIYVDLTGFEGTTS